MSLTRGRRLLHALSTLIAGPAAAQTGDTTAFPLAEIVVSAERPVSEEVATVRVIGQAEMTALGARTLDETLALVPGLNIRRGGEGVARVDVRGLRTRQVTLLLNGIPLNATDDGQFDPGLLPVEEIAEIKLTGGTGSVLYGQGGLGGTINVVTRSGYGAARADLRGELREANTRLGRLAGSAGSGPVTVFASGSVSDADPFHSWSASPTLGPVTGARRSNSDRERQNGFVQASFALGPKAAAGLTVSAVHGEQGSPPSVIDDPADPFANRPVFDRVDDLDGLAVQLAASYTAAPGYTTRAWLYRNLQHTAASRYADGRLDPAEVLATAGTSRDRSRSLLTGAGAQVGLGFVPAGRLTLGLVADRDLWQQSSLAA
ncbi:MAG TPA: TonB-dependent receptor plug domain-containing protein, partial [Gemmatimonadales bacterium]|nr:TonB-dependent receptor plug domain-containing protein [Gemmatimonadales bacterium]